MIETLTDTFTAEQKRVRELLDFYKAIGPAGIFGTIMLKRILKRADKAVLEDDPVAIDERLFLTKKFS